jgi:ferritin
MGKSTLLVNEALIELLNQQIQNETKAAAQYMAIAVYFESESLPALASFFFTQATEEREHAMKFIRYLLDAGSKPEIRGLPDLRNDFTSAADAVSCALDGELEVTRQINHLVGEASRNNDHMTHAFLQWFVTEQLEEVSTMSTLLDTIRHAGDQLLLVEDFVRRGALAHETEPA